MTYKCGRCGKTFEMEDLKLIPSIMCPFCGYRVVYKIRPPIAKKVKAV